DINPQIQALRRGVELVIATPGRLLDHVQQKSINLGQVQVLVLDEADRMLDMGFLPDLQRIINLLPKTRQNLLFSATFSP
ncbi:DEAD/DEAH box helicase, partial [Streptococcus agalactiae]|uniref:DEAD/DEAH box helicase n=2 Tax=Bacteria TaxID=2 RepID=UPI00178C4D66